MMKPDRETTYAGPTGFRAGRVPHTKKRGTMRRGLRDDRGQAVTEFAMVMPLFAAMVFVLVLFGKALYVYIQVSHIANEAARLVAVDRPGTADLATCSSNCLQTFLTSQYSLPSGAKIAICYPTPTDPSITLQGPGAPAEIVAYTSSSWIPIINIGPFIKASATMRLEQDTSANPYLAPLDPDHVCP